jgi:hypothetical protein
MEFIQKPAKSGAIPVIVFRKSKERSVSHPHSKASISCIFFIDLSLIPRATSQDSAKYWGLLELFCKRLMSSILHTQSAKAACRFQDSKHFVEKSRNQRM